MPERVPSSWFTATQFRRLSTVLEAMPGDRTRKSVRQIAKAAWPGVLGQLGELDRTLKVLSELKLAIIRDESARRTTAGNKVVRAARTGNFRPLGEALIRSGYFYDQARALLESGRVDDGGNVACANALGRRQAPQLVGLLSYWPDVQVRPSIRIPRAVVEELNAVWALLPPPPEVPEWEAERRAVGQRAEMYSYRLERERAGDPSKIIWVAQDDDSLGWDIEDRCIDPLRHIEVKGSRGPELVFFMSKNELERAREHREQYEVHFWGAVDLQRRPDGEYDALRDAGYPLVISNVAKALEDGEYNATPDRWCVERA